MRIPKSVEAAIIENRRNANEQAERMREYQEEQGIATDGVTFRTFPTTLDKELQFWGIEPDEELGDFLINDLLGAFMISFPEEAWRYLPQGYAPLITVLEFESNCQFDGWVAISNEGVDRMQDIIQAYRYFNLSDEAEALQTVVEASASTDVYAEDYETILGAAYGSVRNSTPEFEERLSILVKFVQDHPEEFASTSSAS